MQVLLIDSSILGDASASRALTHEVLNSITSLVPTSKLIYRDVVEEPIAHLTGAIAAGFRPIGPTTFDAATAREHARSASLVDEFVASDVVVIGAPMYNFSVSSQLKAWIDRIVQPGRTFKYTPEGPVGLAGPKAVIVVSTRGGSYLSGPMSGLDFQEAYIKAAFRFMGITDVQFVRAENLSRGAGASAKSMASAREEIDNVVRLALTV
ncbi:FMN-dependent NADH-azoreductase [Achromobacter xylosoxidans]|nr:FMN-dependent NADH-azoreductase [Achromobacter xylosoxidans]